MAAVQGFSEGDPINYYNNDEPTDPHPAPGFVTAVNGGDYDVEIILADGSRRGERHVEAAGFELLARYIELRDRETSGV